MEIGSEFELNIADLEMVNDTIFKYLEKYHAIYTNSGRSATRLLNGMLPKGKILLPNYICQSVIDVYKQDFTIVYYQVNRELGIDLQDLEEKIDDEVKIVYLMHYFGRLQSKKVLESISRWREKYHYRVIEDTTHSIFTCANTIGDYCVCSLRKWFPISDGGVVYSKRMLTSFNDIALPQKIGYEKITAMVLKYSKIRYNTACNDIYRMIFRQEEERVEQEEEIYAISCISKLLLNCYSVTKMITKRKENLQCLRENLLDKKIELLFEENYDYIPFALPVYSKSRDNFRKHLIDHNIFCAVHWPVEDEGLKANNVLHEIVGSIISLPLDQRYDENYMKYMVQMIGKY